MGDVGDAELHAPVAVHDFVGVLHARQHGLGLGRTLAAGHDAEIMSGSVVGGAYAVALGLVAHEVIGYILCRRREIIDLVGDVGVVRGHDSPYISRAGDVGDEIFVGCERGYHFVEFRTLLLSGGVVEREAELRCARRDFGCNDEPVESVGGKLGDGIAFASHFGDEIGRVGLGYIVGLVAPRRMTRGCKLQSVIGESCGYDVFVVVPRRAQEIGFEL